MATFAGAYELDPTHTTIGFVVRHAMVTKVRGRFDDWNAAIDLDSDPAIAVTIKADSINTGNAERDAHTKNDDFFAVDRYPEITFVSTSIDIDGGKLEGNLTIRDTTKPVSLDVEVSGEEVDPYGNTRVGFEAGTKINRTDFGVSFQAPLKSGGLLVSEQVTIEVEGSAIKK